MAASATTSTALPRKKGVKRPQDSEPISGLKLMAELVEAEAPLSKKLKSSGETSSSKSIDGGGTQKYHNKENMQENKQVMVLDWTSDDLTELVNHISQQLPKNDCSKYSTLMEKLDWERVSFEPYSAVECKEKFHQILTRLRRFRTMTELVGDAKEWLKNPCISLQQAKKLQAKHPDLPKKPLTPYFRYFLEKRKKYQKMYPEKSVTELSKFISQKFSKLPPEELQVLKDQYNREMVEYKRKVEQFKIDHPAISKKLEQQVANGKREKPHTPYQLFMLSRLSKAEFAQMDKKESQEKIKKLWSNLSDGKKVKWIRRAVQEEHDLLKDIPDNYKGILTKSEKELKDRYDGKPERPPNSGYSLFSKIKLRELKNVPSKEKMSEISRQWRNLSDTDREEFNRQAVKANQTYKESYNNYLLNLNEDEKNRAAAAAEADSKAAQQPPPPTPQKKKVQHSPEEEAGLASYQAEMLTGLYESRPDISQEDALKLLAQQYHSLPRHIKAKYIPGESQEKAIGKENQTSSKKYVFKGEPKKPPQSGYGVFSAEMLSKLTDVDSKYRMQEIAKLWNKMTDKQKDAYKEKGKEMMKKYNVALQKFLMTLNPDQLNLYRQRVKGGTGKGTVSETKQSSQASRKESSPAAESSSSGSDDDEDDSSGDDDSSDSDDDDGSSSSSSSEEESGKQIKEEVDTSSSDDDNDSNSSGDSDDDDDDDDDEEDEAASSK